MRILCVSNIFSIQCDQKGLHLHRVEDAPSSAIQLHCCARNTKAPIWVYMQATRDAEIIMCSIRVEFSKCILETGLSTKMISYEKQSLIIRIVSVTKDFRCRERICLVIVGVLLSDVLLFYVMFMCLMFSDSFYVGAFCLI